MFQFCFAIIMTAFVMSLCFDTEMNKLLYIPFIRPPHLVEINSLMNGTRRLMFPIEIKIKYLLV